MNRQYQFEPQEHDPLITAQRHWNDMRDELNVTRDQLEASEAREASQAALIDMLRKELDASKSAHSRDQIALTIMRTKLKASGLLILDALKADEAEQMKEPPRTQSAALGPSPPQQFQPAIAPKALQDLPSGSHGAADLNEPDDDEADIIAGLPRRIQNKWP